MTEKKRFVVDAFWSTAYSILSRVGAFIFIIILTRFVLTPSEFGLYTLALSIASFIFLFVDLGLNQTISTTLARYIDRDPEKARSYFRVIFGIKILLGLFFVGMLIIFSTSVPQLFGKAELEKPLIFASVFTFLLSLLAFFDAVVYVRSKLGILFSREAILQVSRFIGVWLVVSAGAVSSLLLETFQVLIFSVAIALLFLLFFLRADLKKILFGKHSEIDVRGVLKETAIISLGTLALVSFTYIDVIMLGFAVPNEYVGFYRAAMALIASVVGLLSFGSITTPLFSRNDAHTNTYSFKKITRFIALLAIPATVGMMVLSKEIIELVYGSAYAASGVILFWIAPATIFLILASVLFSFFIGMKKADIFTRYAGITIVLGIILNFLSILFGRTDFEKTLLVGFSTVISWFFLVVLLLRVLSKENVSLSGKSFVKIFVAASGMGLAIVIIKNLINFSLLIDTISLVFLGGFIYGSILFLIREITREDFSLFKN